MSTIKETSAQKKASHLRHNGAIANRPLLSWHNSILHHNCVETSLCKATSIKPLASYPSPWPNAEVAKETATRKQHKAPKYVLTSWLFICIKDLHLDTNKELLKWHCLDQ